MTYPMTLTMCEFVYIYSFIYLLCHEVSLLLMVGVNVWERGEGNIFHCVATDGEMTDPMIPEYETT